MSSKKSRLHSSLIINIAGNVTCIPSPRTNMRKHVYDSCSICEIILCNLHGSHCLFHKILAIIFDLAESVSNLPHTLLIAPYLHICRLSSLPLIEMTGVSLCPTPEHFQFPPFLFLIFYIPLKETTHSLNVRPLKNSL